MRQWVGVLTLIAAGAGPALAEDAPQGDAQAGATKAAVCLACHGLDGNSTNAEWPNLASQHATYTTEQLKLFRSQARNNPVMTPLAAALSDQDIADLSAYYESQKPAGLEADPSYWEAGQKFYRGGDAARNIPACVACHGPVGRGNAPARYPALQAQHAVYTQKQLNDYAAGQRPGERAKIMQEIAKRMTPEEIRNVSSYLQGMR